MTNFVRFTSNIGDTTWAVSKQYRARQIGLVTLKHNISCIVFLVLQAPVWEFLSSFRVTTSAPILYGFGHLIKVLYNGTLVIELCANFWTYMIPTYLIALCARFSFFLNNLRAQFVPKPWYRVDDNPAYKCLPGRGAGVGPRKKKDRLMPSWSSGWHDSPSHLGGQGVGPGNLFHGAFNLATQTIVC